MEQQLATGQALKTLYPRCPLCDAPFFSFLREANCTGHPMWNWRLPRELRWMRCDSCEHVFTDGYWTPEALAIIFEKTQPMQQPLAQLDVQRAISGRIIDRVSPHLPKKARRWLDVGFGSGALMTTADEYGYDTIGLDLREENVRALRELGYAASCSDLKDYKFDEFDVISLADVLEHVADPKEMLKHAKRLMTPTGILFISTPNRDCAMWKHLDNVGNPYWAEIEHHHIFTRESLYELLREHDFVPLSYHVSERYLSCMEVIARAI